MRVLALAFLVFIFYRVGNFIPLPFVFVDSALSQVDIFQNVAKTGIINQQALQRMSLFSLGIVPYITAGIIVQLARYVFSDTAHAEKFKDKKSLSAQTLKFTFVLSLVQSFMFARYALADNFLSMQGFVVVLCLMAGSFITVWFAKIITSFGYGNGASILIVFSIVEYFYLNSADIISGLSDGLTMPVDFIGHVVYALLTILIITFVESAYRPLRLIYPSQRNKYGFEQKKKVDILPLKINNSGVLPLIFATSFSSLLSMFLVPLIFKYTGFDFNFFVTFIMLGLVVFFVLFYTPLVLNTEEISKNLKKSCILLENRRPGDVTKLYIDSVVLKLNYLAIIYLAVMIIVPDMLKHFGVHVVISGVSCVILVSVIMDIMRRVQYSRYSQKFNTLLH